MRVITERGETERRRAAPSRHASRTILSQLDFVALASDALVASDFITTERALSFTSIENASFVCIAVYVCIWRLTPARAGTPTHRIPAAPDAAAAAAAEARAGTPTDRTPAAASAAAEAPAAAAAEERAGTPTDRTPARRACCCCTCCCCCVAGACTPVCGGTCPLYATVLCASTLPTYATGFPQYPSEGACAPSTAEDPRLRHRGRWTTRRSPRRHHPAAGVASDSFFFFDPPAPMPSGFALPSLDFPPPNPSRLRSAEASIIMSFSFAAFFFSSFSSCAGLALSSPLAVPELPCDTTEETLPDWFMRVPPRSPAAAPASGEASAARARVLRLRRLRRFRLRRLRRGCSRARCGCCGCCCVCCWWWSRGWCAVAAG